MTRLDYFKTLPIRQKRKAIKNTPEDMLKMEVSGIDYALYGAFVWDESPEGHKYWNRVLEKQLGIHSV